MILLPAIFLFQKARRTGVSLVGLVFFETEFLYVTTLAVLELKGQANLQLTDIHLSLPPKCWD